MYNSLFFHNVVFPVSMSIGSSCSVHYPVEVTRFASGTETRQAKWRHSKRLYDVGGGVKSKPDLERLMGFFEARRGRLYGFRWVDAFDHTSSPSQQQPAATDQPIGMGDGKTQEFALIKHYGTTEHGYERRIHFAQIDTLKLAIDGQVLPADAFSLDEFTGIVTLKQAPAAGESITAGYIFHIPVRFDTDELRITQNHIEAGTIASIPIIEINPDEADKRNFS